MLIVSCTSEPAQHYCHHLTTEPAPRLAAKSLTTGLFDLQHNRTCTALLLPARDGASSKTGGESLSTGLQHIRACTALLSAYDYDGASPKTGGKSLSTGLQHIRASPKTGRTSEPAQNFCQLTTASPKTAGKSLKTGLLIAHQSLHSTTVTSLRQRQL